MTADPRVARLRSLDTEATEGPWRGEGFAVVRNLRGYGILGVAKTGRDPDAALIAAMRNTWPAMVTLLEGVLDRHPRVEVDPDECACGLPFPCPDRRDALAGLDTLDPP
jgi:hypothetical protein